MLMVDFNKHVSYWFISLLILTNSEYFVDVNLLEFIIDNILWIKFSPEIIVWY